jgi:Domain of unknown function (DUF4349)
MSERNGNTATADRDLAAVEAALASGQAVNDDPLTRELGELALALRAESPVPDPAFGDRLGEGVRAGFPPEPGSARARAEAAGLSLRGAPRRAVLGGRQLLPVVGIVGAILLPVVLVATLAGPPGDGDGEGSGGGGSVAAPRSERGGGSGVRPAEPVSPPGDGGFAPGQPDRRIERSISLDLEVPLEEMARVAEDVTEVTNRHGGFVLSSSVDTGEDGGGGDFSLRIPVDRLRPALRDLTQLAPVIRQTQEGRDVTRQHVTAADRLQAAGAERRSLLRRLAVADTDERPSRSGAGSISWPARSMGSAPSSATCASGPTTRSCWSASSFPTAARTAGSAAQAAPSTTRSETPATCWCAPPVS